MTTAQQGAQEEVERAALEAVAYRLLTILEPGPMREALRETPARWARMWLEFKRGADPFVLTTFESVTVDQMVVVKGMRVWSMCEHHLLPFWCDVTIGYLTTHRLLGLSKFGRLARAAASKLQVQERLVREIADAIGIATGTEHVAVLAEGEHLCMSMRGAKMDARMVSSDVRGAFRDAGPVRQEFFYLAGK